MMSMYLARKGLKVNLIEKRPDARLQKKNVGRSINLTLASRALAALDELGIKDLILKHTVPLKGRLIHKANGQTEFQPYGKAPRDKIYSISRATLNNLLLDHSGTFENIDLRFNTTCTDIYKCKRQIHLMDNLSRETIIQEPDMVVGADGCFSTVSAKMHMGEISSRRQERHNWGYKELTFPADSQGNPCMQDDVLHVWPRGSSLLLAMPNNDGSFTGTLCMPVIGEASFDKLAEKSALENYCKKEFRDLHEFIPHMVNGLSSVKVSAFMSTSVSPWFYDDWIVLLGDACHTVLPFYGQGMNATFEDCSALEKMITDNNSRKNAFKAYETERKRNTDALTELSEKNFVELRDSIQSPFPGYKKKLDYFLHHIFEDRWQPIYTLVAQSTIPYADCVKIAEKQNKILKWSGVDFILWVCSMLIRPVHKIKRKKLKPVVQASRSEPNYIKENKNIDLSKNVQNKEQIKSLDVTTDEVI